MVHTFEKFVKYLQLTENSDDYIKNIATNFKKIFIDYVHHQSAFGQLTSDHYRDDNTLFTYISNIINNNPELRMFNKINDDIAIEYDGDDDDIEDNETFSFSTKVKVLESVIKYASFIRPHDYYLIYRKSVAEVRRFSNKNKLRRQGTVSVSIQDNVFPRHIVTKLINHLRQRQTYINSVLYRWFQFGNFYKNRDELNKFGETELQPFIELCMRFTFVPMSLSRIRNIRINTSTKFKLPEMLYTKTNVIKGDVILFNEQSKKLVLVSSLVSPSDNESIVRTSKDISIPLSVYIYFLSRYCNKTSPKRLEDNNGMYLFNGPQGGSWKQENIPIQVRNYAANNLKLSDDILSDLGLYVNKRTKYIERSYVLWVASTTSNQYPDKVERAIIATRRLNIANEERQNRNDTLRSLRFTQDSVNHILPELSAESGCLHREYIEDNNTLNPIPPELFHIWAEMCQHWNEHNIDTAYTVVNEDKFEANKNDVITVYTA